MKLKDFCTGENLFGGIILVLTERNEFDYWDKKNTPPFLQKSEFQNQGNSILMGLFGNISMLILQNDMTQEICFRENKHFVLWDKKGYSNI